MSSQHLQPPCSSLYGTMGSFSISSCPAHPEHPRSLATAIDRRVKQLAKARVMPSKTYIILEDDSPSFKSAKSESSRCFPAESYIQTSTSQLPRPQQTLAAPCDSQTAPSSNKLVDCLASFVVTSSVAQAAGSAAVPPILSQTPLYNISYPPIRQRDWPSLPWTVKL